MKRRNRVRNVCISVMFLARARKRARERERESLCVRVFVRDVYDGPCMEVVCFHWPANWKVFVVVFAGGDTVHEDLFGLLDNREHPRLAVGVTVRCRVRTVAIIRVTYYKYDLVF